MLEKAAAIKIFEYSPLGKELKKQTSVANKYQIFDNAFESNKKKRSRAKSDLVYNNYFNFYKYRNTNEFTKDSLDSKLYDLKDFKDRLELFYYHNI